MKKTLITTALLLAISACSEDGGGSSLTFPTETTGGTTAFGGGTGTGTGGTDGTGTGGMGTGTGGTDGTGTGGMGTGTGGTDGTGTGGTGTGGTIGSFDISSMVNGTSGNDFQTFWACTDVGETDPENYFTMRFYSDASGAYGGGGAIIEYSWSSTANNIDMVFPGDARSLRFANIAFSNSGNMTTSFEVTDSSPQPLDCELLDLEGNPVSSGETTGAGGTTGSGGTTGGTTSGTTGGTGGTSNFDISAMTNGTSENDFRTFWRCSDVGETDPEAYFSMRFYADASGAYGGGGTIIEYSWSSTANNIDMAFPNDSRSLRFANIAFSGKGDITTDFEITGETSSPLNCQLLDLDGVAVY